jgi:hypothetical protein
LLATRQREFRSASRSRATSQSRALASLPPVITLIVDRLLAFVLDDVGTLNSDVWNLDRGEDWLLGVLQNGIDMLLQDGSYEVRCGDLVFKWVSLSPFLFAKAVLNDVSSFDRRSTIGGPIFSRLQFILSANTSRPVVPMTFRHKLKRH